MPKTTGFRHNHYVTVWYQKRFMVPGQGVYHYLDLKPETVVSNGHRHTRRDLRILGPGSCFAQDDLYTVQWGNLLNTEIEQFFFGKIDARGKAAVEYFTDFAHPSADREALYDLLTYMSVQKLRTPKGLEWLTLRSKQPGNHTLNLFALQENRELFCAIWTECIWQIADAAQSPTKFIISDHPVTVYNRGCFPGCGYNKQFGDPDIRHAATHTYFPLSIEKMLILTNLSWVRNPYQPETTARPNPNFFRNAMFKYTDIQTHRSLSEEEVLQINYITKMRSLRYIAAADKEWLYPERHLKSTHWSKFGNGYLFMPEPRGIYMGGEVFIGYKDGRHDAFSEYGHKPWQPGYKDPKRFDEESMTLERFQAEFAYLQGPAWRGTSYKFHGTEPHVDTEEHHKADLERARWFRDQARKRGR